MTAPPSPASLVAAFRDACKALRRIGPPVEGEAKKTREGRANQYERRVAAVTALYAAGHAQVAELLAEEARCNDEMHKHRATLRGPLLAGAVAGPNARLAEIRAEIRALLAAVPGGQ